jgi:hypothetical protein
MMVDDRKYRDYYLQAERTAEQRRKDLVVAFDEIHDVKCKVPQSQNIPESGGERERDRPGRDRLAGDSSLDCVTCRHALARDFLSLRMTGPCNSGTPQGRWQYFACFLPAAALPAARSA